MTQSNVNRTNGSPVSSLESILSRHEFVPQPSRSKGIQLAVRNYRYQGVDCYDILVYKQVNEGGNILHEGVNHLLQTLSDLQRELPINPHHLNPRLQSQAISFLRKKAFVLTNESRQPVCCQMIPLLLYQSDDSLPSIRERAIAYPVQIIHHGQLEEFLTQNLPKRALCPNNSNKDLSFLRRSFRNLGFLLILVPVAIGLSGILIGLKLLHIALISILIGILGSVILVRKATGSFKQFQQQNAIPVIQTILQQTCTPHINQTELDSDPFSTLEDTLITPHSFVIRSSAENNTGEDT
jgi:hypothetical protein